MHRNIALLLILCCSAVMMLASGCSNKSDADADSGIDGAVYDDYSTYVFFGTDSRADGEDWKSDTSTGTEGAPSSDVIMLLSVNKDTKDANIVSVYRDTMLDVAGDGSDFEKCNTAYRDGGAYGAIDMLERNLDLNIDGYVTANFMAVAEAIDALGGVDVDVEDQPVDSYYSDVADDVVGVMNAYIKELNDVYGKDTPMIEHAGLQTLTGLQAVAYSRVRYTEGSDVRRTERQRNVVMLMADKMRSSDTETQHRVLKQVYETVETDMTESEMMKLFDLIVDYDLGETNGFPFSLARMFDDKKGTMYVPCDLVSNVSELHKVLYNNDHYEPCRTVSEYSKLIIDESGMTADDAE